MSSHSSARNNQEACEEVIIHRRNEYEEEESLESDSDCENEYSIQGKKRKRGPAIPKKVADFAGDRLQFGKASDSPLSKLVIEVDSLSSLSSDMIRTTQSTLSTAINHFHKVERTFGFIEKLDKKVKYLEKYLKMEPDNEDLKQQYKDALKEALQALN